MHLELPFVAMIDTSLFLCRIGARPDEVEAPACIDFCTRMSKLGRTVLVAAPTITEVTRYQGKPLPRVQGIVVVAFDTVAATELGTKMPISELKVWRAGSERGFAHIKYDALIVGCALRVPRCVFVGMDTGQLALARHVGLAAHHPRDFYNSPKAIGSAEQQPLRLTT